MNRAARVTTPKAWHGGGTGRPRRPLYEDIAGTAIYLASRAGDYVVGATVTVDGGVAFGSPGFEGTSWD